MGQVTDQERRDVAKKLRGVAKKLGPNMDAHEFANYTADVLDADENMTWYQMELRLADLVDPDHIVDPNKMVNRDALIELADEIDANVDKLLADPSLMVGATGLMRCYAICVRAALGIHDAN